MESGSTWRARDILYDSTAWGVSIDLKVWIESKHKREERKRKIQEFEMKEAVHF